MTNNDQPQQTMTSAVMTALSRPSLIKGVLASVALFFSVYLLPVPGFFLYSFTPVPMVYHYINGGRLFGFTLMGVATVVVFVLFTILGGGVEGLTFLVHIGLALAIGEGFVRRLSPGRIVALAAAVFLGITLLVITLDGLSMGMDPVSYIKTYMKEHVRFYLAAYNSLDALDPDSSGQLSLPPQGADPGTTNGPGDQALVPAPDAGSASQPDESLSERTRSFDSPGEQAAVKWANIMIRIAPGSLIVGALLMAWANFLVLRLFLIRLSGMPPDVASLKNWRSPEYLVWPVIACGFGIFLPVGPFRILAANALLVLWLVYFFQGLCIISFWLNRKSVPPLIKTFIYLAIFLQPFIYLVVAIAGLFDLWFDFRKLKREDPGPA